MSISCLTNEQEERQCGTRLRARLADEFDWTIHAGRHLELLSSVTRSALLPVALLSAASAFGLALHADRGLFSSDEPVALTLSAPLNELFQHARSENGYSVGGT